MAAGLAQQKPLSPVTINSRCRMLKTLWRFAVRKRFILVDDDNNLEAVDWIPVDRTNPRAWTIEEMESIVQSARLARGRFLGVQAAKWWPAFLLLLYDTGLRFNAALGCRFDEVDWTNKMLCVPPGRQKNRTEQFFRLHDQTIEALLATLPPKRQLLFPWPFPTQRTLYHRFKVILKRAGLPFTRRDLFHRIRRARAATHLSGGWSVNRRRFASLDTAIRTPSSGISTRDSLLTTTPQNSCRGWPGNLPRRSRCKPSIPSRPRSRCRRSVCDTLANNSAARASIFLSGCTRRKPSTAPTYGRPSRRSVSATKSLPALTNPMGAIPRAGEDDGRQAADRRRERQVDPQGAGAHL